MQRRLSLSMVFYLLVLRLCFCLSGVLNVTLVIDGGFILCVPSSFVRMTKLAWRTRLAWWTRAAWWMKLAFLLLFFFFFFKMRVIFLLIKVHWSFYRLCYFEFFVLQNFVCNKWKEKIVSWDSKGNTLLWSHI